MVENFFNPKAINTNIVDSINLITTLIMKFIGGNSINREDIAPTNADSTKRLLLKPI